MGKDIKADYRESKRRYRQLKAHYIEEKHGIKDAAKLDLQSLKDEYKLKRVSIKKPLKVKKYRLKIQRRAENRRLNEPPKRKLIEEIGNSVTHGVGAIIALVCLILMVGKAKTGTALFASVVYGVCFILQMLFSCFYHTPWMGHLFSFLRQHESLDIIYSVFDEFRCVLAENWSFVAEE